MRPRAADKVSVEAREWFVRLLDDDVSADELALWQAWLARSPAHRSAFDRVSDAWSLGGQGAPRPSIAELAADAYDGSAPVAQWQGKPRRNLRPALVAASVAVAVLGSSAAWFALPAGEAQAITTARAEHKAAALADGSQVQVGALTGVQVRMSDLRREVKLDRGEAFFKVAPDAHRAFVVKTPMGAVRGEGGAFNVDVAGQQLCITVTEGAVVVQPSGLFAKPVRVAAGQQIVLNSSGSVVAAGSPVTWTQGRLEYRDAPLSVVVADVNRYAPHPVVLRDPAVGDLEYTGSVRTDATTDWANGLSAAFPLNVARGEGGVIVLSARS